jgi:hypothetical protein
MLYQSTGILRYSTKPLLKLVLEVDSQISDYYRALMPRSIRINRQYYPPHISVVRKEIPPNMDAWDKYEDKEIDFSYENIIHTDGKVYYWINAYSNRLDEIRLELGLPLTSLYTLPPKGFDKCYHITIGNIKNI